ncbi:MAG TPA: exodeoxyribonuclease V subunit alpha [Verrucomicrobiota bacterium]|nr:exodeoxyribonuclease V subunit alpha [Verrucomicrobiota bacterium]HQL76619.1 exodeoxyribonuclease V subunit alpha [Verrucomicrobiota bacterium]
MNTNELEHPEPAATLAPIDRHFARLMARLSGDMPEVKLAAALVSHQRRLGNICVNLSEYERKAPPLEIASELGFASWPEISTLLKRLGTSPVVGRPGDFKPLVLDGRGRLYLHRYWKYESELAKAIALLAGGNAPVVDRQALKTGLASLFPQQSGADIDWQLVAAFAAMRKRLCIISGGPGTGKTRTVVVLLALLIEQQPAMRIALAAPTGKAAARLQEAVKSAKATLSCKETIKERLPAEASTIHRLLGSIPDSAYFRHDARNPLPFDAVVVDEASMVDLALLAKLVAAIPPSARLILLGDKDQLASVEAGAVLAELCDGGGQHRFSDQFLAEFNLLTGQKLPSQPVAARASDLADCLVELRKNYRFGEQSSIYRLSRAVNEGNSERALEVLRESSDPIGAQVSWKPLPAPAALKEALKPHVLSHYKDYLKAADPTQTLQAFGRFRILCAVRNGPYGVESMNRVVEEILAEAGLIDARALFYAGRPVMVVRNDYNLKLFNGDIGVVLANEVEELRACFVGPEQTIREFAPLRLPEHETAYAMTVHKSQGSEFERVLLILPGEDSAVLTRELVYTGLTRASKEVELWSDQGIFATAVRRKISRRSGLREALWPEEGDSRLSR